MKKQSGFTLIELMVVMAIIAILATAGLAAYTGYIKKARDSKRIADLKAIDTIILGYMATNNGIIPGGEEVDGSFPNLGDINQTIKDANNGKLIEDPLSGKSVCYNSSTSDFTAPCDYYYFVCEHGIEYAVGTSFESSSNISIIEEKNLDLGYGYNMYYVGPCQYAINGATIAE